MTSRIRRSFLARPAHLRYGSCPHAGKKYPCRTQWRCAICTSMSFNMRLLKLPLSDALEHGKAGDRKVRWLGCAPLVLFSHKQLAKRWE